MSDTRYLDWPFFDEWHRQLALQLDTWAAQHVPHEHGADVDEACRSLVRSLGGAGWLKHAAVGGMALLSIAIQFRHERYLQVQAGYQRLLLDHVPESALLLCNASVSELVSYAWGWRDYRHIAEFNVPIPLDSVMTGDRPLYAGLIVKPGAENPVMLAIFEALLARFPERALVVETRSPWLFRLYRLR